MGPEEARDFLWDAPKEQFLDADVYDATAALIRAGDPSVAMMRLNELGEIVMGGGVSADGDTSPTIRFVRSVEVETR